jgi:hypothetical protein
MNYQKPITSLSEAKSFFHSLNKMEKLFHPDDEASTIVDPDGNPIFTEAESELINQRITEIRTFMPDPCDYIIDEFM